MLFSTIISTMDSMKSFCGSKDDFTTAKLSERLLREPELVVVDDEDTLFRPLLPAILGEWILNLTPGELTDSLLKEP